MPFPRSQLLRELCERLPLGAALFDDRLECVQWNAALARISGVAAENALGRNAADVVPAWRTDGTLAHLDQLRRGETVAAPARHDSRFRFSPLHADDGAVCGVLALAAEPKPTSAPLRERKRQPHARWEASSDALITIDEQGVVESFNAAAERIFGYRADEILGKNVSLLMPEPFASEHSDYIQKYLQGGESHIIGVGREVRGKRKDGTLFPADIVVSEFHDGGTLFTAVVRDVTERKRLEAAVLHSAEAEQRRIGQELHDDAQQQLSGLTLIARSAADSLTALVPQLPALAAVQAKVERLVQGLRDANQALRELARGLVPLQLDAHGLTHALVRLAERINEAHAVRCVCSVDDDADVNDSAVATHLYRIAQEAVNNALKHARAREIALRLRSEERMLVLEIADDGVGIEDPRDASGRGLQIMSYRAGLIGAVLTVRNGPGGGAVVRCGVPRP